MKLAITAASAAQLSDGARWILCGGVALAFGATALLRLATTHSGPNRNSWLHGGTVALALLLAAAGRGLTPILVVGLLPLALAGQVVVDVVRQTRPAAP